MSQILDLINVQNAVNSGLGLGVTHVNSFPLANTANNNNYQGVFLGDSSGN
jgi:hypothetical protein